jgi:hypothetical protein
MGLATRNWYSFQSSNTNSQISFNFVKIDRIQLTLLETLAAIVVIFTPIGIAIAYIVKLRGDVKNLKLQVKDLRDQITKDIKSGDDIVKSDLDGKIKVIDTHIEHHKSEMRRLDEQLSDLSKLFRDLGFKFITRKGQPSEQL